MAEGFVYTRPVRRLWSGVQYGDVSQVLGVAASAFEACTDAAADYYHCGGQPFQHSVGVCNGRSGADVYKISTGLEKGSWAHIFRFWLKKQAHIGDFHL